MAAIGLTLMILSAGCSSRDSSAPVKLATLDRALLLEIGRQAVAARLPSVTVADLEPRCVLYTCYRDLVSDRTNELFEARFRIQSSKRQVEKDGATVFQADEISVSIDPDGQIGTGGVCRVTATYASPDLGLLSHMGSDRNPVWGRPFYPVRLDAPLARPDRRHVDEIALRAIGEFLPAVNTRGLQLDQLSFFDITGPDSSLIEPCYLVTYWNTNSLKVVSTSSKVTIEGEQVTVRIAADGQVRRDAVSTQPLHFTCNRAMLEEWRRNAAGRPAPSDADQPDTPASPAP